MKTESYTPAKKPPEKREPRVYGDVRTLTETSATGMGVLGGGLYSGMPGILKTGG